MWLIKHHKAFEKLICSKCPADINRDYAPCVECKRCYDFEAGYKACKKKQLLHYINSSITDLRGSDIGAMRIYKDDAGHKVVDIEWCDGVSTFSFKKVMKLIGKKGWLTKADLIDNCLAY